MTATSRYYLANGTCIEYVLSPSNSVVNLIDRLNSDYHSFYCPEAKVFAWVSPVAMSMLIKQNSLLYDGVSSLTVHTAFGPVPVILKPDLEWPIFVGSEQELKDNSFMHCMEEILCA